LTVQMID